MRILRRALEATANGLLVALLAPPIAALVFVAVSVASRAAVRESFDTSLGGTLLLILGVATGSYLIGAIPAFLAGMTLPSLRRRLPPMPASLATGLVGAVAYALTFGSHLMSGPNLMDSIRTYALPAFVGVAIAALVVLRIERPYAEA